jgi:hypothetical protein
MAFSTCCGAHTNFTEYGICPDCLEHCDWEIEDEDELKEDEQTENNINQHQINQNDSN